MYIKLIDNANSRRFKAWNGGFYYTPLESDSHVLIIKDCADFLFYYSKGDLLILYNNDGTFYSGRFGDFSLDSPVF